jgi:hypothetical protein
MSLVASCGVMNIHRYGDVCVVPSLYDLFWIDAKRLGIFFIFFLMNLTEDAFLRRRRRVIYTNCYGAVAVRADLNRNRPVRTIALALL